jgi:hypothetical protein
LTTSEIVRLLHAKRAGNNKWQAHCPVLRNHSHNDRNPSLSIGIGNKPGFTVLKCQAGCDVHDIVAALGWRMRDLCGDGPITPAMRQYQSDHERLEILEHRHGLFMMLQVVESGKRNYWAAAERNTAIEIKELRRILYPVEAYWNRKNEIAQHLIAEYGLDELMNCLPEVHPCT